MCADRRAISALERAKRVLAEINSPASREAAIRKAMQLGMPLSDIERYLDWLDNLPRSESSKPESENEA